MGAEGRVSVGLWSELGPGARWANEGVSRVVGFLIEGAAVGRKYTFHILVPYGMGETVREDLRQLSAVENRDWVVWEPPAPAQGEALSELADFANRSVPVEAWIVTFPHFSGSLHLTKPKATLYPDALPYDFPLGWNEENAWGPDGSWPKWRRTATNVMAESAAVITFSRHVAERHAGPLCDVPLKKVRVVPLAPPDLAPLLPFVTNRQQTAESRSRAADILRKYATEQGLDYLRGFPFEEVNFVAAATQDRPTKNLGLTAEAVRRVVRKRRGNLKLFMTARLHVGAAWTKLPEIVRRGQFHHDLISLPDLPRDVHAALLHCATLVVHSSFFEGIIGSLPFYEAASVGTPSLLARGPHIDELLETEPTIEAFVYDPYDTDRLADLIVDVASNRETCVKTQAEIFGRLVKRSWSEVATEYAQAALSGVVPKSAC